MKGNDLHEQLRLHFGHPDPSLTRIRAMEAEVEEKFSCNEFPGYFLFVESFLGFLASTLDNVGANLTVRADWKWYRVFLGYYCAIYSRHAAAEIIARRGYPLEAFVLIRDLKDRSFFLSGIFRGDTCFSKIYGIDESDQAQGMELEKTDVSAEKMSSGA